MNDRHHPAHAARRALHALGELDGIAAANRAVAQCSADCSLIFLTRSEYEDLAYRSNVASGELKRYKRKVIVVISDDPLQA